MKILIIHNDYQQAGGERAAVNAQIQLLRQHGHEVIVFWRDNAAISQFSVTDKAAFFIQTIYSSAVYEEITRLVHAERIDVAHVHNVFPLISPAVYRALHDAGVPILQTIHNFRLLCPNALFYTRNHICELCKRGNMVHAVRLRCYRDSFALSSLYAATISLHRRLGTFALIDRFLVLTEFSRQKLVESGLTPLEKVEVLGNFLPDPLPDPNLTWPRQPYIAYIGRLSEEKGPQLAIDAIADLPHIELKIAGEGPLRSELEDHVARRTLANVTFLGAVAGDAKWALLKNATATIVPSRCYETFSLATIESAVVGTPVLASNIGSLPFVVKQGSTGLLFDPTDIADIRRQIVRLSDDVMLAEQMGSNARDNVIRQYSAKAHYNALLAHYRLN